MKKQLLKSKYLLLEGPLLCKKYIPELSIAHDWGELQFIAPLWYVINGNYYLEKIDSLKILWGGNYLPYGENADYNKNIEYIQKTLNKSFICKIKTVLFEFKYYLIKYLILDSGRIAKPFYYINYWLYGKILKILNNYNDFIYPLLEKMPSHKLTSEEQIVKENIALQIVKEICNKKSS